MSPGGNASALRGSRLPAEADEVVKLEQIGPGPDVFARFRQLRDEELGKSGPGGGNSVATIVWHIAGNLDSRFTDFLTSDGEKPWRNRDSEFQAREGVSRTELLERWNGGWQTVFGALEKLSDEDLSHEVTIRGEKFRRVGFWK